MQHNAHCAFICLRSRYINIQDVLAAVAVALHNPVISPKMLIHNTLPLVDKLIALDGSTTLFLESLRGARLKVRIESQIETNASSQLTIVRTVKLFFESAEIPILYCKSFLNKHQLTEEEYRSLMTKEIPIGIVFHRFNDASSITKRNISISKEMNPDLAVLLNVKSSTLFKKKYEYWVGNRGVGYICEFFNEESLARI